MFGDLVVLGGRGEEGRFLCYLEYFLEYHANF